MTNHNDDLALRVAALGQRACVELFSDYGVELGASSGGWADSEERLLSGVIGFVGRRVRGTCLLAGSEGPLAASCPEGGRLYDWVGELANQLVGRLKSKLLGLGVEVALTTPIVLSGVRLKPLPRGRLEPAVMSAAAGPVMVWTEVDADREFALGSEHPGLTGREGAVLLF
jgi:hypothetical protein